MKYDDNGKTRENYNKTLSEFIKQKDKEAPSNIRQFASNSKKTGRTKNEDPKIMDIKDHFKKHGKEFNSSNIANYREAALNNIKKVNDNQDAKVRFYQKGKERYAYITKNQDGSYNFTSGNMNASKIFTHFKVVNEKYLSGKGITLKEKFR